MQSHEIVPDGKAGDWPTTTTAADLVVLRDWLAAHGVTHVATESTGVLVGWTLPVRDHGRAGRTTITMNRDSICRTWALI